MLRRLPLIVGVVAALAALLVLGPIAVAVALLRSSSDAVGPGLGVQLFIGALVLAVCAVAGLTAAGLTRLVLRLIGRGRRP